MAKKKNKEKKKKNQKSKGFGIGFKGLFLLFCLAVFSVVFVSTSLLLVVGMLPTLVALVVDRDPGKNKSFTIGAMNFAGCFPYLLGTWTASEPMEAAIAYLANPVTIIVMYAAAAAGYIINWFVTVSVASILVQRSKGRIEKIEKKKLALEERWGKKVNGHFELDEYGFPIQRLEQDNN